MVLPLLVLIPILYVVQEMTVRLGVLTHKGHGALILEHFGRRWALLSALTLFACSVGALLTEFAGIAGVGELFGVPRGLSVPVATAFLIGIALTGSYRRVERIGIALGLAELIFIPAVIFAHPNLHALGQGLTHVPLANSSFIILLAANVGAVIMPWMIFYQQSATVDKKLTVDDLPMARVDTAIGAVATQCIMIAIIITTAATLFVHHQSVSDAAHAALALVPLTGAHWAGTAFGAGLLGAAMIGALVVTLATSWAFGEAFHWPCSLNLQAGKAKRFYGLYVAMVAVSAGVVLIPGLPLIPITINVMAFNAFVLPIVLGFLLVMANDKRILGDRVNSWLGNLIAFGVSIVCVALGLWLAVLTVTGQAGS
jgi:Mn2+/Fe2+ NRAMP family transporter